MQTEGVAPQGGKLSVKHLSQDIAATHHKGRRCHRHYEKIRKMNRIQSYCNVLLKMSNFDQKSWEMQINGEVWAAPGEIKQSVET